MHWCLRAILGFMIDFLRLFLVLGVVTVFGSLPALAQEGFDPESIPQVYLDDMQDFYAECRADPAFKNSYDCRCLSLAYLDEIQELGNYDRAQVIADLEKNACRRTELTDKKEEAEQIPQDYLDEMQAFYEECESNYYLSGHHDCRCMASEYLDERIEQGRFADSSLIRLNVTKSCPSEERAAGYSYRSCFDNGYTVPEGYDVEAFCACTANQYARLFARSGQSFGPQLFIALQSEARQICRRLVRQ